MFNLNTLKELKGQSQWKLCLMFTEHGSIHTIMVNNIPPGGQVSDAWSRWDGNLTSLPSY